MRVRVARTGIRVRFLGAIVAIGLLLVSACGASPSETGIPSTIAPAGRPTARNVQDQPRSGDDGMPVPPRQARFETISVDQGLSEGSVSCVYQDSGGFLWFCTQDGLNRYDGQDFFIYKPGGENSVSVNYVQSVCESPAGVLWIATIGGGLDRLDTETGLFSHYRARDHGTGPVSDWLQSLYCDRDGSVWVGGKGAGLSRFDPATEAFTHYQYQEGKPGSLSNGTVHAIFRDRQGVLWIATDGGLNRFDPMKQRFVGYQHDPGDPNSLTEGAVRAIFQDREGALWVGTEGGLNRYDRKAERFERFQHDPGDPGSLGHNAVRAIYEDGDGVLWIGTVEGLSALDRKNGGFLNYRHDPLDPNSLSSGWIQSIFQDREGVLWFGTHGSGVSKLDRHSGRFAHYRTLPGNPNSLASNMVWAIYEDPEGILWVGTGAGLDRFDRQQGQVTHYVHDPDDANSLSHNTVRAIVQDRDGALWIGTGGGLNRFDPESGTWRSYEHDPDDAWSLSHNAVSVLHIDPTGTLWIGTDGEGLSRYDREQDRFTRFDKVPNVPGALVRGSIWSLADDAPRAGETARGLLIGTAGAGVHRLDPNTYAVESLYHAEDDVFLSIHPDAQGRVWLATYGNGLYRYDPASDNLEIMTEAAGLPSNAILGIVEEGAAPGGAPDGGASHRGGGKVLWLSTNNGLARLDTETGAFKNYDALDGLQSREFNGGAYHRSRSGELFFGGINGFNAFYPSEIREENPYVPPVVLTSLTRGGQPLLPDTLPDRVHDFELTWPDTFFEFEFAALSFSRPESNQYAYKLEGFDRDWTYAGTDPLGRYTNLPGGSYTLRLIASNGEGVWNREGAAIGLTVVPPFWQTWAFRIIAIVVVIAGAGGFYFSRLRSVQARSFQLEQQVLERTSEIQRRRRVAEGLRDILAVLNSDRPVDEVLDYIIVQARELTGAGAALLHTLEPGRPFLAIQASDGLPGELAGIEFIPFGASWADEAILSREPYVVADLAAAVQEGPDGQPGAGEPAAQEPGPAEPEAEQWLAVTGQHFRSYLAVPLTVEGTVSHSLAFYYAGEQAFSDEELNLAVALADQAALAIENARLYERATELAAVEERQRLARDLHDAVSQTLFSASLIAETLPELWANDADEGELFLQKLQKLTRGALAEMRGLLMELRPATLVEASMRDLLRQLGQAVSGREGIPVAVEADDPCDLPADVQIALYRIAQEALNNVVKHARAEQVEVELACWGTTDPSPALGTGSGRRTADDRQRILRPRSGQAPDDAIRQVVLMIRDYGLGFDPSVAAPERLGLGIMRERADSVGAELSIVSEPGAGTQVTVVWAPGDDGDGSFAYAQDRLWTMDESRVSDHGSRPVIDSVPQVSEHEERQTHE